MGSITATIINACLKGAPEEYILERKDIVVFVAASQEYPGFFDLLTMRPHPAKRSKAGGETHHLRKPVKASALLPCIHRLTGLRVSKSTSGWEIARPGTFKCMLESALRNSTPSPA